MDPKVVSLDIETYGIAKTDWWGRPLPPQRIFNPRGSIVHDGVARESMILCVSLTIPTTNTRNFETTGDAALSEKNLWNASSLASLVPGSTMVLEMHREEHRRILRNWLRYADTLIGMNLQFDIQYLRMFHDFRHVLTPKRHTIIDLSVVNFLHSELRPERSLKTLGPVLGTHVYPEKELNRERAYEYPSPEMLEYCGRDTHNTMLAVARLASRILSDFPKSDKLSPYSVQFYSDAIWSCIRMSEAGIPVDVERLAEIESRLIRREAALVSRIKRRAGLVMEGKGSQKSKSEYMEHLCDLVDSVGSDPQSPASSSPPTRGVLATVYTGPTSMGEVLELSKRNTPPGWGTEPTPLSVRSHPLLQVTEAKQDISFNQQNRNLLAGMLPPDHEAQSTLREISRLNEAQKVVGTYTYPLLRHKRKNWDKWEDRLTPWPPPKSLSSLLTPPTLPSRTTDTTPEPTESAEHGSESPEAAPSSLSDPRLQRLSSRLSGRFSTLSKRRYKQLLKRLSESLTESPTSRPPLCPALTAQASEKRPFAPQIALAISNWLVVPTHPKDGLGDAGGTKQGRIIAKAGARPQTWPPLLKSSIIRSRFPNGIILQGDLKQVEPRMAGLLSGDPALLQVFRDNLDIHGVTSKKLFGADVADRHPFVAGTNGQRDSGWKSGDIATDPRQWGKTGFLLMLYRGGWEKMQATVLNDAGILLDEGLCRQVAAGMPTVYPGLWEWQEALIATARRDGYALLPFTGQSRWFMGGTDWDGNEIVNQPVQTWAGNVLLRIQARMEVDLPDINDPAPDILMIHNWYDAIYLDCRDAKAAARGRQLLLDAVDYVESHDCWGFLQDLYGRQVPLEMDIKEL